MRVLEHPEEVVIYEYLSRRVRPGADADRGNFKGFGDRRAHWCGDTLQDDRKRARVLPTRARARHAPELSANRAFRALAPLYLSRHLQCQSVVEERACFGRGPARHKTPVS